MLTNISFQPITIGNHNFVGADFGSSPSSSSASSASSSHSPINNSSSIVQDVNNVNNINPSLDTNTTSGSAGSISDPTVNNPNTNTSNTNTSSTNTSSTNNCFSEGGGGGNNSSSNPSNSSSNGNLNNSSSTSSIHLPSPGGQSPSSLSGQSIGSSFATLPGQQQSLTGGPDVSTTSANGGTDTKGVGSSTIAASSSGSISATASLSSSATATSSCPGGSGPSPGAAAPGATSSLLGLGNYPFTHSQKYLSLSFPFTLLPFQFLSWLLSISIHPFFSRSLFSDTFFTLLAFLSSSSVKTSLFYFCTHFSLPPSCPFCPSLHLILVHPSLSLPLYLFPLFLYTFPPPSHFPS